MSRPRKPRVQHLEAFAKSSIDLARERLATDQTGVMNLGAVALAEVTHAYGMQAMVGAARGHVNVRGRLEAVAMQAMRSADFPHTSIAEVYTGQPTPNKLLEI